MRNYEVGDPVLLAFDAPGSVGITNEMYKYKDRRFRISKKRNVKARNKKAGTLLTYYELKGFVSEHGLPYAVTADWIRPIKELKR